VNDDRIGRELNQTAITLFTLFQRLSDAMRSTSARPFTSSSSFRNGRSR
jgi:hypothetical protein